MESHPHTGVVQVIAASTNALWLGKRLVQKACDSWPVKFRISLLEKRLGLYLWRIFLGWVVRQSPVDIIQTYLREAKRTPGKIILEMALGGR